jgi:hypothetical protein
MWDCVFALVSGCFTPNHTCETNTSQGKADYTIVSTASHYVWIFFEYKYIVLYDKGKGMQILEKG